MANDEHIALLKKGVDAWNAWRLKNLDIPPDLSDANLSEARLVEANLIKANLIKANLGSVNLVERTSAGRTSAGRTSNVVHWWTLILRMLISRVATCGACQHGA